jgi:type I restriction enzyme R subunit
VVALRSRPPKRFWVTLFDAEVTSTAASSGDQPGTVKVFNLLKAVHDFVEEKAAQQPYLISIGDKAEEIVRAFEGRQKTTQDTLQALERLVAEVAEAQKRKDEAELSPDAFAVFWMLQRAEVPQALKVARAVGEAFAAYPHWQTSTHQEQDVRKAIYKALINAGVDGVIEVATGILKTLRRAAP